jgi:hypothetical protein
VQSVVNMKEEELVQVIRCGFNVLDRVHRSIFMSNMSRILKDTEQATFVKTTVKSTVLNTPGACKEVRKKHEEFAKRWSRRGHTVLFHVNALPKSVRNIMSVFDNTEKWGRTARTEFKCR